jgi:hypothetical protein
MPAPYTRFPAKLTGKAASALRRAAMSWVQGEKHKDA